MIGHSLTASESWKSLPWKQFQKTLFRLQQRVYKSDVFGGSFPRKARAAVRVKDKRKARSLQKLILKSQAAKLLAIRQVTQLNAGKKTAGIDGKASFTFEERFTLANELSQHHTNWKHKGLREIPIPKKRSLSGRVSRPWKRPKRTELLGCSKCLQSQTGLGNALQNLLSNQLRVATFHSQSYGFRTGRSAHDAQKRLFLNLRSQSNGKDKRVIELDIEKCFDRINHSAIMDNLIAPAGLKLGIFRCLKAGTNVGFPDQGTPQGGVVSPLLANIALNGIEDIHTSIRYADDMVIILKQSDNAEVILNRRLEAGGTIISSARWMGLEIVSGSSTTELLRCSIRKPNRINILSLN